MLALTASATSAPARRLATTRLAAAKSQAGAPRRLATRKVFPTLRSLDKPFSTRARCNGQVLGPNNLPLPGACVFVTGRQNCITVTNAGRPERVVPVLAGNLPGPIPMSVLLDGRAVVAR